MTEVSIVGVDLAKQAFQLHAAARDGMVVFRRKLSRSKFVEVMAKLPRCVVAMEACATAHYWGRVLGAQGHEVRLIPPGQVKVADKANEIVAIPKLLDLLAIEGAIVTLDAIGCQRAIAQQILDKKADYVLALKGNQGTLREDVELFAAEQIETQKELITVAARCGARYASAPCRVKGAIAALCVGGPRLSAVRKRSDGGAGRRRPRAHAHLPALNAEFIRYAGCSGLRLNLYGNSRPIAVMPSPLMNIWDATFKEKARRPCGYRRPAGRWSGRWRGVAVFHHVQRSHRCPRHRPEARTSRAAPAPRSGYPIQIVSNRLPARIFVTDL